MIDKTQLLNGVIMFIDSVMIPKSEGNYKILLRTVKAMIQIAPDKAWDLVANNSVGRMLLDNDLETVESILVEGLSNNEFEIAFKLLSSEYKIYLTGDDIHGLKDCIMRCKT